MAEAASVTDPTIPQVLLFGHAGSGKSSLLAALMRAGEIQGEALHGEVQEASGRLAEIRDAVYRGTALVPTETELMSYQVRVRPWKRDRDATARTFILHDCSGEAAENLIRHPSSLRDPDIRASIARAVVDADAILLLVDATADDEELHEAFEEFDTFLTVVAQGKASAREVGGFPILLVLTKCDRAGQGWRHASSLGSAGPRPRRADLEAVRRVPEGRRPRRRDFVPLPALRQRGPLRPRRRDPRARASRFARPPGHALSRRRTVPRLLRGGRCTPHPRHLVEPPAHLDDPRRGRARVRDGPRGAGGRALPARPRNARSRRAGQGLPRARTPAGATTRRRQHRPLQARSWRTSATTRPSPRYPRIIGHSCWIGCRNSTPTRPIAASWRSR